MLSFLTRVIPLLLLGVVSVHSVQAAPADGFVLDKVVQVSRHGVRPPTDSAKLAKVTGRELPKWSVPDGHLTGHGYAAAVEMGRYRGQVLRAAGLLPNGCPAPGEVFVRASPLQRTQATATALLDGLFPGCGLQPSVVQGDKDALFQADKMPFARLDPQRAEDSVLARMGGSVAGAQARYRGAEQQLRNVICAEATACQYRDQPWQLVEDEEGRVAIKGLSLEANLGETFRLEYSEGLPLDQVAFGQGVTPAQVAQLTTLTKAKYDFINDSLYIASRGGSQLMNQISLALKQGTPQAVNDALGNPPDARFTLLVAHDTNISYLRTMLGFRWALGDYLEGNIPPVGSLQFERYKQLKTGRYFLRVAFEAQSLDQIRQLAPLATAQPPLHADLASGEGCVRTQAGLLCPMDVALKRLEQHIDRTALTAYSYR
ncbi:histidine-type phosphatase [Pseudomonas sp. Bout1]|uniref:histidine-type phosphatase n=1 Tax=Pseudomonas sp. Bout1 TaxID=3048600 RepID=UPI002AB46FEB|nr:histidine-type phosphatase [Pseudomonas sp. Bout1]MDY7534677.1 histidine-type phosphatase [Pseudomonas sp. Bout1]MEB0188116.1 histidine-type phosphatase [Pseudomonas sp. Bout1]